ncbi:MAG: DUF2283 domain-containing protein [Gammaproteobacteria bacterium]
MRVRVDKGSDAVYLDLTGAPIESSEEVAPGMIADYDAKGHLVGIELLDASKHAGDIGILEEITVLSKTKPSGKTPAHL